MYRFRQGFTMSQTTLDSSMASCLPEPNITEWLKEAKEDPSAPFIGMYLTHNGVVRATPKRIVRANEFEHDPSLNTPVTEGNQKSQEVIAVDFSYNKEGLEKAVNQARSWEGVYYVRVWLNEGLVPVGGSLMYILIGADIRPHAIDALEKLVGHIKTNLVVETEVYAS